MMVPVNIPPSEEAQSMTNHPTMLPTLTLAAIVAALLLVSLLAANVRREFQTVPQLPRPRPAWRNLAPRPPARGRHRLGRVAHPYRPNVPR